MLSLLGRALFALAADALCEKIRPTVPYDASWQMKVDGGPWEYHWMAEVARRRPWQATPPPRSLPRILYHVGLPKIGEEITIRGYLVAPAPTKSGTVFVGPSARLWGPGA